MALPNYLTPIHGEELIAMVLEHPKDAQHYLEILELRHLLPKAAANRKFVPVLFLGLLDIEPTITVITAHKEWPHHSEQQMILVAGQHESAGNRQFLNEESLKRHLSGARDLELYSQVVADNTPEQARWLCEKVMSLGLNSIALCAPWFHIPRAYLTVVNTMNELGIYFDLLPWPQELNPGTSYPFAGFADSGKNIELLPGEFKRLFNYRGKGVANYEVTDKYLNRLRESLANIWQKTAAKGTRKSALILSHIIVLVEFYIYAMMDTLC